jgi:branched-chain amino acid transport system permease protein
MDAMRRRIQSLPFGLGRYTVYQLTVGTLVILGLVVFPLIDTNSSHISAVADTGYVLLLAFGLNVVVGYTGLLVLGYAAFFAIGAYTYAMVASPQFGLHANFWIMIPVGGLVAADRKSVV